ncbi:MAG: hypothetical protein P4L43_09000 [Syntrophobacteraceae bacterium]|nr:hypothetical protein [Syntrophobacteraceae bacterium]
MIEFVHRMSGLPPVPLRYALSALERAVAPAGHAAVKEAKTRVAVKMTPNEMKQHLFMALNSFSLRQSHDWGNQSEAL